MVIRYAGLVGSTIRLFVQRIQEESQRTKDEKGEGAVICGIPFPKPFRPPVYHKPEAIVGSPELDPPTERTEPRDVHSTCWFIALESVDPNDVG